MSSSDDEDAFEAFLSTFLTIFFLFIGISLFCACRRCCCSRRLRRGVVLGPQQPSAIINITRGAHHQQPIIRSTSPPPPPLMPPSLPVQAYQQQANPGAPYPGQYGATTTTTTYYPVPGSVPPAQGPPPATFFPPPPPYEAMFPAQHANSQPSFNPEFSAPPGYSEKQ